MRIWQFSRATVAALALAIIAILLPVQAYADSMVVVETNVRSLREGTSLNRRHEFELRDGQYVVLLTESGSILEIEGPFAGRIETDGKRANPSVLEELEDMVLRTERGVGDPAGKRGPSFYDWLFWSRHEDLRTTVEVLMGGTWCVIEDPPPELFRRVYFGPPAKVHLRDLQTGDEGTTSWGLIGTRAIWPKELPIYDGATYEIRVDDGDPVRFTLRLAPNGDTTAPEQLNWMAEVGCDEQVQYAIGEIRDRI